MVFQDVRQLTIIIENENYITTISRFLTYVTPKYGLVVLMVKEFKMVLFETIL